MIDSTKEFSEMSIKKELHTPDKVDGKLKPLDDLKCDGHLLVR